MNSMKVAIYIVLSLALVWFGGAGLAFATCPGTNTLPACPCNHGHGESCCCCDGNSSEKSAPACSFNPASVPLCACNYDRDASSTSAVTVYTSTDSAMVINPTIFAANQASNIVLHTFPVLPSSYTPFTPLRI